MMTTTDVADVPPFTRDEAHTLALTEYTRMVEQLRSLGPDDWTRPTDCPLWDVRDMAGHSVGMMGDFTSLRSVMRRMSAATKDAKSTGGPVVDSMTAMQVADHADLTTGELIARAEAHGPRAARWRTKGFTPLRWMPMKEEVDGVAETWKFGYLFDTILTRDPWMHRVDIARATGRDMVLTPDHDGRLVAGVVAEWARRHGQPFTLVLTGPIGTTYVSGAGGETITIDTLEFCRILSGRAEGTGLLAHSVPF
ncbi:MAG: maleylpyruvate isomerase family mycothiol-dependent enzyme [Acidimicrobiales bacterium]